MTDFEHDDLPPDLADLGRRLRNERPVAEDDALARMTPRIQTPRPAPRRAPRRAFAVSMATVLAMVSITGVAAAAFFGMSFNSLGQALTGSSQRAGTSSTQALRAPAVPSRAALPSIAAPSTALSARPTTGLGRLPGATPSGAATAGTAGLLPGLIPGNLLNAGNFQYGPGRLVCRILVALGLRRIAALLGCFGPPPPGGGDDDDDD